MRLYDRIKAGSRRWMWLCPPLAVVLAAEMLMLWGLTLWTAIGVVLVLVCPVIVLWAMLYLGRDEVRDRLLEEHRGKHNS